MKNLRAITRSRRLATASCVLLLSSLVLPALLSPGVALGAGNEPASRQEMQSLDEQVQEIKSDVLGISAELLQLEEKLLFPSNTQVAVFISMPKDDELRIDSLKVRIDGEPVAHHVYSFKELEALQKGGVQRIYTGNVRSGEHALEVTVAGKLGSGEDYEKVEAFHFTKEVKPKLVGITVSGGASGPASIELDGL